MTCVESEFSFPPPAWKGTPPGPGRSRPPCSRIKSRAVAWYVVVAR